MLKLIHIADVHLGAKFVNLGPERASKQREFIKSSFKKTIDIAIEKKVDFFVIAGDLFDNPYPSATSISFARDSLYELSDANIKVIILPGNHDRLEDGSVFTKEDLFQNDPNIFVFKSKTQKEINFEELNITFFANSVYDQKSTVSPLVGIKELLEASASKFKVVLAHGNLTIFDNNANFPITKEEIEALKCNYLALGDWHSFFDASTGLTKAFYPGSPEMVDMDQKGAGSLCYVEIENETKVEKIDVGQKFYKVLNIEMGKIATIDEFLKILNNEKNENLIFEVNLIGQLNFSLNIEEIIEEYQNQFFVFILNDKTEVALDFTNMQVSPDSILGKYVLLLNEKIKSEPDNSKNLEALNMGYKILKNL